MADLRIRHAAEEDAGQIAAIHVNSWRTTYDGIVDPEILRSLSVDSRGVAWRRTIEEGESNVLVAEDSREHTLAGFCQSGPARDRDPRFNSEIYTIYLPLEYQRMGIGRALMRASASLLIEQGYNSSYVWVLALNPYAKFYEALGGKLSGRRGITIGRSDLEEISYAWDDIRLLL